MAIGGMIWRKLIRLLIATLLLLFFNEYLIYYVVLRKCAWPNLRNNSSDKDALKVMILADVHLLGFRQGHWFDKLRREWQMERSFQTSMFMHKPDVIFILGDLFDEGKWCSDFEFEYHADRFKRMFSVPSNTQLHVVAGNHDMGFHYMIDDHKRLRFFKHFSTPTVHMVTIGGNFFILLNSMAFEGDRCSMCTEAKVQLKKVQSELSCTQEPGPYCSKSSTNYSQPILMQHFPLYRQSDWNCTGPDSAPEDEKFVPMKPKWDCLDKGISQELLSKLKPRLVFSGHTHHFCVTDHDSTPEWSVPSFSWRYKKQSSFIMMSLLPSSYKVSKCYLPNENTVVYNYIIGIPVVVIVTFFPWDLIRKRPRFKVM